MAKGEGTRYERAVVRCTCGYVPQRQPAAGGGAGGPVLEMHKGGRAGAVAGPENDGMGVSDRDGAHYGCLGTVMETGAEAAQGSA